MSTGANTGSTGAATTSKGSNVAVSGHFCLILVKICHFCREMLTIILDYAAGEFFYWHFYAWGRGRILILPALGHSTQVHVRPADGQGPLARMHVVFLLRLKNVTHRT